MLSVLTHFECRKCNRYTSCLRTRMQLQQTTYCYSECTEVHVVWRQVRCVRTRERLPAGEDLSLGGDVGQDGCLNYVKTSVSAVTRTHYNRILVTSVVRFRGWGGGGSHNLYAYSFRFSKWRAECKRQGEDLPRVVIVVVRRRGFATSGITVIVGSRPRVRCARSCPPGECHRSRAGRREIFSSSFFLFFSFFPLFVFVP